MRKKTNSQARVCVCRFVCICVCLLVLSPFVCPVAFLLTSKAKRNKKVTVKQNVRYAGWTVNFLNPPPSVSHSLPHACTHTHRRYWTLLFVPALSPIFFPIPPPLSASLYSASFLSVAAFDLSTSIQPNLTRQRKVTCTQGGQGEVGFVPRGAASVPKDCRQCDKDEGGGGWAHLTLGGLWMLELTHTAVCIKRLSLQEFYIVTTANMELYMII